MPRFDTDTFSGVSVEHGDQRILITFVDHDDSVQNVSLPAEEVPPLVLYLSRAWSAARASKDGLPALAHTLKVHNHQVLHGVGNSAVLILTLGEGLEVSFSMTPELSQTLGNDLLDPE